MATQHSARRIVVICGAVLALVVGANLVQLDRQRAEAPAEPDLITQAFEGVRRSPAAQAENDAARERVQAAQRDAYAGRRALVAQLKDPESFRLDAAEWHPTQGAICYTYRARNSFGGVNVSQAVYQPATRALELSERDRKGFASTWALMCAGEAIAFNL